MTGMVFNIQPYSLHDGAGIRTVVFLKGCPLSCGWCANPESQHPYPEVYFDQEKCICSQGCDFCKEACDIASFSARETNEKLQGDCGCFRDICPTGAVGVYGKEMTVEEVLDRVEADNAFYVHGGGGLTISGGEPFYQGSFVLTLLKEAKVRRISTAAETCGYCGTELLKEAAGYLDEILFDIKLLDDKRHQEHTGRSNQPILRNLEMLFREYPQLPKKIRTPVIPGVNDREEDIAEIAEYLRGKDNYTYELLPYHRFGVGKYRLLERIYGNYPDHLDEDTFQRLKTITSVPV